VETTHTLAELGDDFREIVIPTCDYSGGLSSFPLVMLQVTRFKCGEVCLGFAAHHHLVDGMSISFFFSSWARLARGLQLQAQPFVDRIDYLAPRNPPEVNFQHLEYDQPLPPILPEGLSGEIDATSRECMFTFTKHDIKTLNLQATYLDSEAQEANSHKLSTYEVLAGHVWRTACKARGLTGDQDVKLYIPTDGRSRLRDPTLPQGYLGNAIFFTACIAKAGDITCKPLRYAASKVQEALKRVQNTEYLRSAIDYLESEPDLSTLVRGAQHVTCPNLVEPELPEFLQSEQSADKSSRSLIAE
ncbi:hypothetical protein SOVF_034810, partial [Spinacia oleracea]